MPVYFFTGKLGSGKTLCAVGKARDYMGQSRRVASNIDMDVQKFGAKTVAKTAHVVRIPDKPTAADMENLGYGYGDGSEPYAEEKFGLILLDELGTWFNSRSWNDKSRKALIDWCVHARKYRWDVAFIVQDISMVDGQLRDGVCEFLVVCKRADRVKILGITPPKIHVAAVYNDSKPNKNAKFERWVYRGRDLYGAYDTGQVFSAEYDKGVYCPITEDYFNEEPKQLQADNPKYSKIPWRSLSAYPIAAAVFGVIFGAVAVTFASDRNTPVDTVATAENQELPAEAGPKIAPPIDWLGGLGVLHYAGSYQESRGLSKHFFSSSVIGMINEGYFTDTGATVKVLSSCGVQIRWPDGQVNLVGCDSRGNSTPQYIDNMRFQNGVSM